MIWRYVFISLSIFLVFRSRPTPPPPRRFLLRVCISEWGSCQHIGYGTMTLRMSVKIKKKQLFYERYLQRIGNKYILHEQIHIEYAWNMPVRSPGVFYYYLLIGHKIRYDILYYLLFIYHRIWYIILLKLQDYHRIPISNATHVQKKLINIYFLLPSYLPEEFNPLLT